MVINPCCPKFLEVKELKSCAIIAQFSLSTKAMNPDWKKKEKASSRVPYFKSEEVSIETPSVRS